MSENRLNHNYMRKLLALAQTRPGIFPVNIAHDDWCAIYSGGYCNCDPDIELEDRE